MLIGYARVSTKDQKLDLQLDALKQAGCDKIFADKMSGTKADRPELAKALGLLRSGDTLVVCRLDRLGRSLKHLLEIVTTLHEQGIGFKVLNGDIDTTTTAGKLVFSIFGALAEFEKELIRERTQEGLKAARARGRLGGRPKALDEKQILMAKQLHDDKNNDIDAICKTLKISRPTLYRYLRQAKLLLPVEGPST